MEFKELNRNDNGKRLLTCVYGFCIILSFTLTMMLLTININGQQREIIFYDRDDYFMDFFNTIYHVAGRTPYTWGGVQDRVCAPLWYILMYPFTHWYDYETNGPYLARTDQLAMFSFVLFLTASLYLFFAVINKAIKQNEFEKNVLFISFLCCAPMIFNYDRANLTIIAASALFFFVGNYQSENKFIRQGAYLALAVAAALKLFPAIFGILLLYEKRWKDALVTIGYGVVVFFGPFLLLKGGLNNIPLWFHCVQAHEEAYLFSGSYGLFTHTILDKNVAVLLQKAGGYALLIVSLVIGKYIKEDWEKILLLTCAILLTSGQQAYYCGIYLAFPIIMFFNQIEIKSESVILTILFVIIMSPFQYLIFLPENNSLLAGSVSTKNVQNICLVFIYLYLIGKGIGQTITTLKDG